jgi:hypothetical protein
MHFRGTIRIARFIPAAVVALVCLTMMPAFASPCKGEIETFLGSPSKSNYSHMMSPETPGKAATCWDVIAANSDNRDKMAKLAAAGSQWAIRFVAIAIKTRDGGDLEDALKILGQATHSAPALLCLWTSRGQSQITN